MDYDPSFQTGIEALDTGENLGEEEEPEPEEDFQPIDPREVIARAEDGKVSQEALLEALAQRDQIERVTSRGAGLAITGKNRSKANRRLTTIEKAALLIRRSQELKQNAPTPLTPIIGYGTWLTGHMTPAEWESWYENLVTSPYDLANLEYTLGMLDDWEVFKHYPDGRYEIWSVKELPFLRR